MKIFFVILTDAVIHMYTHDRCWPQISDLAVALGVRCILTDSDSGGSAFDETFSNPWAKIADHFPGFPIPFACQTSTVELRGQYDVSQCQYNNFRDTATTVTSRFVFFSFLHRPMQVNDTLALKDATALFQFLQRRGYILADTSEGALPLPPLPSLLRDASPLTGVDMIKVRVGDDIYLNKINMVAFSIQQCVLFILNSFELLHTFCRLVWLVCWPGK